MRRNPTPNQPHPDLIKNSKQNKVSTMNKMDGPNLMLWCNYSEHIKQKAGQGFEIWGRSQQVVENITKAVFTYYPAAEITSQSAGHVIFRLR